MQGNIECADLAATFESAVFDAVIIGQATLDTVIGSEVQIDVGETINYIKAGDEEIAAAVREGTAALNLNANGKITEYNNNVIVQTTAFNDNAASKTTAFDNNAAVKQAAVDASAALAENWATKTDGKVDGSEFSAKYYAGQAAEIIASADVVHKSGAETISGAKTFTQDVAAKIGYTRGVAPVSNVYPKPFIIYDANSNIFACIQLSFLTSKSTRVELLAYNGADADDSAPASMGVVNNGGSKYTFAPTPTEDTSASTQIDTVGARNTKLANYVTLGSDQDITGRKNFIGGYNNVRLKMSSTDESTYTDLAFFKDDGTRIGCIRGTATGNLSLSATGSVVSQASDASNSIVITRDISKAQNGYVQLGNGVIINWGRTTVQTSSQTETVTFSKAYSSNNAAHVALQAGGSDMPKVSSINSTSFVLSRQPTSASASPATYTWIAVGY